MAVDYVEKVIKQHHHKKTALISILHDLQKKYSFLPAEALKKVALNLGMDINDIYGVATFYKAFTLIPKGQHSITLCLGTACHVRGGPRILREIKILLKIEHGQTTSDKKFSLDVVNCLGACAVGPVMIVDGKIHGEMNPLKAKKLIEKLSQNKKRERAI